jgi:hypothetical protein
MAAKLEALGWSNLTPAQLIETREVDEYKAAERQRRGIDSIVKEAWLVRLKHRIL